MEEDVIQGHIVKMYEKLGLGYDLFDVIKKGVQAKHR